MLGKPPVELGYVAGWVPFQELQSRLTTYVGYTPGPERRRRAVDERAALHWTPDGLPVGVQLAGRAGGEALLFQLAYQLEDAQPVGAPQTAGLACKPRGPASNRCGPFLLAAGRREITPRRTPS